jgi:hypothetical protein
MNTKQAVIIVSGPDIKTLQTNINQVLSDLTDDITVQNMFYFNDTADFHCSIWIVKFTQ